MSGMWLIQGMVITGGVWLGATSVWAAPPSSGRDLGTEARSIFAAKCASCHGPDLVKPKGRFGYVLDLRRVAANPEMVIPGEPAESEMWQLIAHNEMPPADSPRGPLRSDQKETIREWIAAGAPDASLPISDSPASGDTGDMGDIGEAEPPATLAGVDRFLGWVGKFHLLFLHFPIALFVAAGAGEMLSILRRTSRPSEAVRFCLWFGLLAAVPTVALGWLFAAAGNGVTSPQLLLAHRWLGTAAAVWFGVTALTAERDHRQRTRSWTVRLLLASGIAVTGAAAHVGGLIVHGREFFTY